MAIKTQHDRVVVGADGRISGVGRVVSDDVVKILKLDKYIVGISGDSAAAQLINTNKIELQKILGDKTYRTDERKLSQLAYYIKKSTKKYVGSVEDIEVLLATPRQILTTDIYGSISKNLTHNAIGSGSDIAGYITEWEIFANKKEFPRIIDAKDYMKQIFEYVKKKDTTVGGNVIYKII